ncbi:ABC transporter substrate-binding protein, partial [Duganella sp. FT134W]
PPPAPPAEVALTIATNTAYVGACPVMAAQRQGYFAAQRLRVTLQPHSSGKQALEAVLSRQAELATVADIPVVLAALDGRPVQILATIFRTGRDHGLVARRDRGIHSGADLRGKRIGVTLATSGHFALEVWLNRQRLDTADVTLVNYAPAALLPALAGGAVDAISGWDPFLDSAQQALGAGALRFSDADVYQSIYNMVALAGYLRQQPQTAVRLLRALDQGEQFCRRHPQQAMAFLAGLSPAGRAAVLAAWPAHHFGLELDQSLLLALEDQARWAIKNGLGASRQVPNFLDYVATDALQAVRPAEVTILY